MPISDFYSVRANVTLAATSSTPLLSLYGTAAKRVSRPRRKRTQSQAEQRAEDGFHRGNAQGEGPHSFRSIQ